MQDKSDQDWQSKLTEEEYRVLREAGTEAPFSGELLKNDQDGTYHCKACGQKLFASDTKFDSGTGWPSFYDVIDKGNVELKDDSSLGMNRTEVVCANCGSHLGHVFEDGPEPTGKRYCINSVALNFNDSNSS